MGFVAIPRKGWECIGKFNGDILSASGFTPAQAFNAYKEQCKKHRPLLTKLAEWIKS
jgi:hypothetical protein